MFYAFDIETMPDSSKTGSLPEPEVKLGNLKDPAKIAEKVAEARAEQVAKMALNPLYGRICGAVFVAENTSGELESFRYAAGDNDGHRHRYAAAGPSYPADGRQLPVDRGADGGAGGIVGPCGGNGVAAFPPAGR